MIDTEYCYGCKEWRPIHKGRCLECGRVFENIHDDRKQPVRDYDDRALEDDGQPDELTEWHDFDPDC